MAFIESQQNPGIVAEVDPTFRSLRAALRPLEYATLQGKYLGHYSVIAVSAAIAPAANAAIFAARWTDPTNFAVILRMRAFVTVVTAVTAQRNDPIVVNFARAYTARDATNATVVNISGQNQKRRSYPMATSLFGNIDIANAAAGLTGGTKTVDANPHGAVGIGGSGLVGLGTNGGGELFNSENNYLHPLTLSAQEGVLINWGPTALATGTVTVTVEMAWAEVATF
jgi:hypothetical protein